MQCPLIFQVSVSNGYKTAPSEVFITVLTEFQTSADYNFSLERLEITLIESDALCKIY